MVQRYKFICVCVCMCVTVCVCVCVFGFDLMTTDPFVDNNCSVTYGLIHSLGQGFNPLSTRPHQNVVWYNNILD